MRDFDRVMGIMAGLVVFYAGVLAVSGKRQGVLFFTMMMPTFDQITDIFYLLNGVFYRDYMFWMCFCCMITSSLPFVLDDIVLVRNWPVIWWPYNVKPMWLSFHLQGNRYVPLVNDIEQPVWKAVLYIPLFLGTSMFALAWIGLYGCFLVFWFVVGTFLFQSRSMAVGKIRKFWYLWWRNRDVYNGKEPVEVDTAVMNKALYSGIFCETLFQLVIQFVNNMLMHDSAGDWDAGAMFSTFCSVYMALSGVYKFFYYKSQGLNMANMPGMYSHYYHYLLSIIVIY